MCVFSEYEAWRDRKGKLSACVLFRKIADNRDLIKLTVISFYGGHDDEIKDRKTENQKPEAYKSGDEGQPDRGVDEYADEHNDVERNSDHQRGDREENGLESMETRQPVRLVRCDHYDAVNQTAKAAYKVSEITDQRSDVRVKSKCSFTT